MNRTNPVHLATAAGKRSVSGSQIFLKPFLSEVAWRTRPLAESAVEVSIEKKPQLWSACAVQTLQNPAALLHVLL